MEGILSLIYIYLVKREIAMCSPNIGQDTQRCKDHYMSTEQIHVCIIMGILKPIGGANW